MIEVSHFYFIAGIMFFVFSFYNLFNYEKDLRYRIFGFLFWLLYSFTFLLPKVLPSVVIGLIVIFLAILAGFNFLQPSKVTENIHEQDFCKEQSNKYNNILFIPAILVPILTLIGTFVLPLIPIFDKNNATLVSLGLAAIISLAISFAVFKTNANRVFKRASYTMDSISWAALLPQTLAALGAIFIAVGMGDKISFLIENYIQFDSKFLAVVSYTVSMALFTMIMGNAFAAFGVITAAIAYPILVVKMGADPAVLGAVGMLSGFCGTLMTPMAANFNIIPVALLNINDKLGVIKAQFKSAIILLFLNTLIIYIFAF